MKKNIRRNLLLGKSAVIGTHYAVVIRSFLFTRYLVLGDHRLQSKDSRYFGFVSDEAIMGEVEFRYYPLNHIGVP